ncbi:hypothetical protein D1007_51287 [Hordeum vulgare]|nr:hypothetical protein D1007_51287 [Hordeum vulgare]
MREAVASVQMTMETADTEPSRSGMRSRSMEALGSKLGQMQAKACEATRFAARHGCPYHKNNQFVIHLPTV